VARQRAATLRMRSIEPTDVPIATALLEGAATW
jgi:hypothetical protein